jgi:hypothetical protein
MEHLPGRGFAKNPNSSFCLPAVQITTVGWLACVWLQAAVKKEAMDSSLEEQMKDKEAVEAENAAQACLIQQHEAGVRVGVGQTWPVGSW